MKWSECHIGFRSLMMSLNVGVGAMFIIISTPPPSPVAVYVAPLPVAPKIVPAISGTPIRLVIKKLSLNLPVGTGSYDSATKEWTLSATKAYYADASLPANDSNGVTLIYGHAQAPVFYRLPELRPGARAEVYTNNKRVFHYKYQKVENVAPTDTNIFTASGPPRLILQTCAGAWDTYRAMYAFAFVNEESL